MDSLPRIPPKPKWTFKTAEHRELVLAPGWQIRELLKTCRRVALVGLNPDESSEAMVRARRLLAYDFELFPVHTSCSTLLGHACNQHLHDIRSDIDIVVLLPGNADISPLHVANEAIQKRVRVFWFEDQDAPPELVELLVANGVQVVTNRSLEQEFAKLN